MFTSFLELEELKAKQAKQAVCAQPLAIKEGTALVVLGTSAGNASSHQNVD